MKVSIPKAALSFGQLPNECLALARLRLRINNAIGVHPKALLNFDTVDAENKVLANQRMCGYVNPKELYINSCDCIHLS